MTLPASLAAITLTYLFITKVAMQQPTSRYRPHGRNVGRRTLVEPSNGRRIVVVTSALHASLSSSAGQCRSRFDAVGFLSERGHMARLNRNFDAVIQEVSSVRPGEPA